MTTTLILPAPDPHGPLLHIDALSDSQIDALIDLHVFGFSTLCTGYIELHYAGNGASSYRCTRCFASCSYQSAGSYFGRSEHARLIPRYSIEDIIFAMKHRSRLTQWIFAQSLRPKQIAGPMAAQLHAVVMSLSARSVAIAALKALGVLDADGAFLVRIGA